MGAVAFTSLLARDQAGIRFHVWRTYLGILHEVGYQAMVEGSSLLIWPCKEASKGCHKGGCYNMDLPGEAIEEYGRGLKFNMELDWPLFAPSEHKFELHDDGSITTELQAAHLCKWPLITRASRRDQIMQTFKARVKSCLEAGVPLAQVMQSLGIPDNFRERLERADFVAVIREFSSQPQFNRVAA